MAQTETQVVGGELETVRKKVPALLERDSFFYGNIEARNVEKVSARDMRIPLELRPGGRFGYFDPSGGDLGRGDGPTFDKATISVVHVKFAVEWQKKAQWATDDARKSVVNSFRHLMAKSMQEFRRQLDSQLMTAGDGAVATVTSVATASSKDTITCSTDGWGVRLLRYGQFVSIYDSAFAAARVITPVSSADLEGTSCRISSIDLQNKKFTLNGTVTSITAGDRVVVSGLTGANPVGMLGVNYHHSDASTGTWLGFDRATTPEIRANRVTASGPLKLTHARLLLNKIRDRVGLENGTKMQAWMHPCQVQAYEELGQAVHVINRTNAKAQGLDLYYDVTQLAGVPVKESNSWDKTRIDFVVNDSWGRAEMNPAGFYEEDGTKLFPVRGVSGGVAAASLFYLVASFNVFLDNPAVAGYISDLDVPSGY
jgi:hypothetical protein